MPRHASILSVSFLFPPSPVVEAMVQTLFLFSLFGIFQSPFLGLFVLPFSSHLSDQAELAGHSYPSWADFLFGLSKS